MRCKYMIGQTILVMTCTLIGLSIVGTLLYFTIYFFMDKEYIAGAVGLLVTIIAAGFTIGSLLIGLEI